MTIIIKGMEDVPVPAITTEQEFVDYYGSLPTSFTDMEGPLTLHEALAREEMVCMAHPDRRQTPEQRLPYLATLMAKAGVLHDAHRHLLSSETTPS